MTFGVYVSAVPDDKLPPMTEAEYFAFTDANEGKYEYQNGQVLSMSGGSIRHGTIGMNIGTHLNILLREEACTVTNSDVRVYVAYKQNYRYPDVTVFCGDAHYMNHRNDILTNPVLLVEVLSPSTVKTDLKIKLEEYTHIPSLQAYLIVSQDEAHVSSYQVNDAGEWVYSGAIGLDATLDVRLMGKRFTVALAEIYRKVNWDEPEPNADNSPATPNE